MIDAPVAPSLLMRLRADSELPLRIIVRPPPHRHSLDTERGGEGGGGGRVHELSFLFLFAFAAPPVPQRA
jgi:hypothetical protein